MDCPACNGMETAPNRANYAAPTKPCSECGGSGQLPQPTAAPEPVQAETQPIQKTG